MYLFVSFEGQTSEASPITQHKPPTQVSQFQADSREN